MDQEFRQRKDWFEVGIVPAIRRRTLIAAGFLVLCIAAWRFWAVEWPLVLAALIVAERAFEFAGISKTKSLIASLKVRATDYGLSFLAEGVNGPVVYPWSSLKYKVQRSQGGVPTEVLIEDRARKNSNLKLVGYERMPELMALIENYASKP